MALGRVVKGRRFLLMWAVIKGILKRVKMLFLVKFIFMPIAVGKEFYCGAGTYIRPRTVIAGNNTVLGGIVGLQIVG